MDAGGAVKLVAALFVAGMVAAFLVPVAVGQFSGDVTTSTNQTTGETVELKAGLNATVDSIDGANNDATYTVEYDNDSATATVSEGANTTVTVSGVDVEIAPTQVNSTYVLTDYTHPQTTGWGAAGALWVIIPVLIVLAVFLYFTGVAVSQI